MSGLKYLSKLIKNPIASLIDDDLRLKICTFVPISVIEVKMFNPLQNLDSYQVVLASGSPRRRELLALLDVPFTVDTTHSVVETVPPGISPDDVPVHLARLKAGAYPLEPGDPRLVITADTVVIADENVLGKPADAMEARVMLHALAGRSHRVVTGVCVCSNDRKEWFSATSHVDFASLSDREIDYYVDRYTPFDKAGAYGIQEWIGAAAISGIRGSFYNVMGLPVHRLYEVLKGF